MLVQRGTLKVGDAIVAGDAWGRVRALYDYRGEKIEAAGPGRSGRDPRLRQAAAGRRARPRRRERPPRPRARAAARRAPAARVAREAGEPRRLAREAVRAAAGRRRRRPQHRPQGRRAGLGRGDRRRARRRSSTPRCASTSSTPASAGSPRTTSTSPPPRTRWSSASTCARRPRRAQLAERQGIEIRQYRVIYELTQQIEQALVGMLSPVETEAVIGEVEVRALFRASRVGTIAGCMVTSGVVRRGAQRPHLPRRRADPRDDDRPAQALQGRRPRGGRGLRVRHPARGLQRPARGRHLRGLRDARGRAHVARRAGPRRRVAAAVPSPSAGFVAILSVELHFPEAGSLKGKRKYVLSAKAQLANRFGASVAEVDHHELWQRCALTAAFVAREAREAEELAAARRAVARGPGVGARRAPSVARSCPPRTSGARHDRADAPRQRVGARGRRRGDRRASSDPRIGIVTVTGVSVSPDLHDGTRLRLGVRQREEAARRRWRRSSRRAASSRAASRASCSMKRTPQLDLRIRSVGRARRAHDEADRRARPGPRLPMTHLETATLTDFDAVVDALRDARPLPRRHAREPRRRRARLDARRDARAARARQGRRHVPRRRRRRSRPSTASCRSARCCASRPPTSASASCSRSTARTSAGIGARAGACSSARALVVDVDHHHDNTRFGAVNLIVADASSTAEIVRDLLAALDVALTPEIAEALYVGLVTDTGRFQYTNTTPKALRLAAELVEAGADVHGDLQARLRDGAVREAEAARACARARAAVRGRAAGRLVPRSAPTSPRSGAEEPYSEGIIDYLRQSEGAELVALIREPPTDRAGRRTASRSARATTRSTCRRSRASRAAAGTSRRPGFSSERLARGDHRVHPPRVRRGGRRGG